MTGPAPTPTRRRADAAVADPRTGHHHVSRRSLWGGRGDLNPRPPGPQPGALTWLSYGHHRCPPAAGRPRERKAYGTRSRLPTSVRAAGAPDPSPSGRRPEARIVPPGAPLAARSAGRCSGRPDRRAVHPHERARGGRGGRRRRTGERTLGVPARHRERTCTSTRGREMGSVVEIPSTRGRPDLDLHRPLGWEYAVSGASSAHLRFGVQPHHGARGCKPLHTPTPCLRSSAG